MEAFKYLYLDSCVTLKLPERQKVLSRIDDAQSSNCLNLSGAQFSDDSCRTLGFALGKDVHIQELDCSNCLLSDEGLMNILLGIERNKFLLTLNLKGNNIRSLGAEAIGKLLRHNNQLQNLCMEWNGLGIFPEKFAILCEGLSVNSSLKYLDLRENQLNDVCTQTLCDSIVRNSSLQKLDLRWNNIGLTGGRALLKVLSKNKSLLSIEIIGNNIPRDTVDAINIATSVSAERFISSKEQIARTKSLATKLQEIEEGKNLQLKSLMEVIEKKENQMHHQEQWCSAKVEELKEVIVEKVEVLEKLTKRIKELENLLSMTVEERNKLSLSLNETEVKNKELLIEHHSLLNKERKNKEEIENKLLEDLGTLNKENFSLKSNVENLRGSQTVLEEKISKLQETVCKLKNQLRSDHISYEEQLLSLNERHEENLRETTLLHRKELSRVREEFSETEKNLMQKISLLESQKSDLAETLKNKSIELLSEKSQAEELLNDTEKKLKVEKDKLKLQMEERIEVIKAANKNQEDMLKEHIETIYDLKTKITALDLSLAEGTHRMQYLQQCLDEKDVEKESAVVKAKLEFKEQMEKLSDLKSKIEELNQENIILKQNIQDIEKIHEENLESKDKIIQELKQEIEQEKQKVHQLLEDEKIRALELQSAFKKYLNSANQSTENSFNMGDLS